MYYVVKGNKVAFWGKLSECAQYLDENIPEDGTNIVPRQALTPEQEEWIHRIKRNLHSSVIQ